MYGKICISALLLLLATLAGNFLSGGAAVDARVAIAEICTADENVGAEARQGSLNCNRGAADAARVVQCPSQRALTADIRQVPAAPQGMTGCVPAARKAAAILPASIDPPPPRAIFRA